MDSSQYVVRVSLTAYETGLLTDFLTENESRIDGLRVSSRTDGASL
jgi:hypothetical protein